MPFVCNLPRIMRLFDFCRNYAKNYASIIHQGLARACDLSLRVLDGPWHPTFSGQQVGEACTPCCKTWVFELYFLFCLSWTQKWKIVYSFLCMDSYLNMYICIMAMLHRQKSTFCLFSLKKENFLPVFPEK